MPKLAKTIEVTRYGRSQFSLKIDGEEFGYYIAREPITTTTDVEDMGTVNLTLMAEHVVVRDSVKDQRTTGTTDLDADTARDLLAKNRGIPNVAEGKVASPVGGKSPQVD